ncbi:hypothetical protein Tco_0700991 [Tanacetum coccineum]
MERVQRKEEMDEEATHEEDEANELYRDVNVNLEGRDTVMMDALLPNVQANSWKNRRYLCDTSPLRQPEVVSFIPGIVDAYLANKMNEAVKTVVQLQSNRLRDDAQAENEYFLNKLDNNIKKLIKNQVKEQVKAQVSKILPKIKKIVNEQLDAEIMTRSSTESKTSLAIAANQSELQQMVEAYESDKLILDTYGDTVLFKRRRDDEDKDEEPSAGSNWGSKRRRAGKEPESTSTPKEKTPKSTGKSTEGSKSLRKSAGESAHAEEPIHTAKDLEEPAHTDFETRATEDQPCR